MPRDIEKGPIGLDSTSDEPDTNSLQDSTDAHIGLESVTLPQLKPSETALSSRSARAALRALEDFDSSPENPRNWPSGRRWRTTLTVAATGFIATTGSSIAVPGIHAAMAEFGETNEKIGVLVASFYVLGFGYVFPR